MSKRLFANLGFLLQISGLLTILPILVGLYFDETKAVISLSLACVTFLGVGFLLNSFCERKELDFKSSNILFLVTFILLPLIGAIPYFYLNPFASPNPLEIFTDGCFESVSGFTTTGFSFIASPETLPNSLLIYRSLTELMGGVGIVFLLLAFFQSKKSLSNLSNSVGIDNVHGNLKKTYLSVFSLYGAVILVFMGFFLLMGYTNLIRTGTYVIDTLTGGYQPSAAQFEQYLGAAPKFFTFLLMLIGAVNFNFIYHLFQRKMKKALTNEVVVFFLIIAIGTIAVSFAANIDIFDSLYHVVSMSGSVGYYYIPLASFGNTGYSLLIVLMIIGGCSFSMAGGIRVSRIIAFTRRTKEKVHIMLEGEDATDLASKSAQDKGNSEGLSASIFIVLFIFTLVLFAIIFTTIGVSFTDALFEITSALTTCGISMGATSVAMPIGYKWLLMLAMIIGRVEMLSIIIALFSIRKKIPINLPSLSQSVDFVVDLVKDILSRLLDFFRDLFSRIRS
jgi:trk system potassium uptake protein